MSSPAYQLVQYLVDEGFGAWPSTSEDVWSLNVAVEPARPDRCITINDAGGGEPDTDDLDLQEHQIDVRIRGAKGQAGYLEAYQMVDQVRDAFIHDAPLVMADGSYYVGIRMIGAFSHIGRDDNDRPVFMASFMVQVDRAMASELLAPALAFRPLGYWEPRLTHLFQDAPGTTPVTVGDNNVRRFVDLTNNALALTNSGTTGATFHTGGGLNWLVAGGGLSLTLGEDLAQPYDVLVAFRYLNSGSTLLRRDGSLLMGRSAVDGGRVSISAGTELLGASLSAGTDYVATFRIDGENSRVALDNGDYVEGNAGDEDVSVLEILPETGSFRLSALFIRPRSTTGLLLSDAEILQLRTALALTQGRVL